MRGTSGGGVSDCRLRWWVGWRGGDSRGEFCGRRMKGRSSYPSNCGGHGGGGGGGGGVGSCTATAAAATATMRAEVRLSRGRRLS